MKNAPSVGGRWRIRVSCIYGGCMIHLLPEGLPYLPRAFHVAARPLGDRRTDRLTAVPVIRPEHSSYIGHGALPPSRIPFSTKISEQRHYSLLLFRRHIAGCQKRGKLSDLFEKRIAV
jgi:hypothetical protein